VLSTNRMIAILALAAGLVAGDIHAREFDRVSQIAGLSQAVAVDSVGNSYVTGRFTGTVTFGLGHANETTLESAAGAGSNFFIAKYDPDDQLLWVRHAGDEVEHIGSAQGQAVAVDVHGNAYVSGVFFNAARFGSGEAGETSFGPTRTDNLFVAKYGADGDLAWATYATLGGQSLGSTDWLFVDEGGNAYFGGSFHPSIMFYSVDGSSGPSLSRTGLAPDNFVAKFDVDGMVQWARNVGSIVGGQLTDITLDNERRVHVVGTFRDHVVFGPPPTGDSFSRPGEVLNILAALDADGNVMSIIPTEMRFGYIAVDGDGNRYLAQEGSLSKYDPDSALIWRAETEGPDIPHFRDVSVDANGISHVIGRISGTVVFGPGEANQTTLSSEPGATFLASFDNDGRLLSAINAVEPGLHRHYSLDEIGGFRLTGNISGPTRFGPGQANEVTLSPGEAGSAFIARFRFNPNPDQSAAAILAFFDASVQAGELAGSGPGNGSSGASRLAALHNMLVTAHDLIEGQYFDSACDQLWQAHRRVDGDPRPPDFAQGMAAPELASRIQALMTALECRH
jgi:hypothetical protein